MTEATQATESQLKRLNKDKLFNLADSYGVEYTDDSTKSDLAAALFKVGAVINAESPEEQDAGGEESEGENKGVSAEVAEVVGSEEDYRQMAYAVSQNIREIREKDNKLFVELACEIHKVKTHKLYLYIENPETGTPYTTMKEYVNKEVDYAARKAAYLVDIYEVFEHQLGVLDQVKHIGWTKLAAIVDIVTEDNWKHWVALAEENSKNALIDLVKQEKIKLGLLQAPSPEGLGTEQTKGVRLQFFPEQLDTYNRALDIAHKIQPDCDNKSELTALICLDFIAANQDVAGSDVPIQALLRGLEAQLGVDLVAIQDRQFIYGVEALKALHESKPKGDSSDNPQTPPQSEPTSENPDDIDDDELF